MNHYYNLYENKYTYCKFPPKYKPIDYGCPCIENKYKKKCGCPINTTTQLSGTFALVCGSSLKIFESDEPIEIDMELSVRDLTDMDLCNLKVKVFLQDENILEFDLPNPNMSQFTQENAISFYGDNVRKVILECESDSGIGCIGSWLFTLPLRQSEKICKCECPVNEVIFRFSNYILECGSSLKIFESDEPVEIFMTIFLEPEFQQDSCDLKVIVELEDDSTLEFHIPNPNVIPNILFSNDIAFYSKNVRKVTFECESGVGTGCMGTWERNIILRGSGIERL